MDKHIIGWILEFLARNQISPYILNLMLTNPNFSVSQTNNPRLKKTICLNTIQNKLLSNDIASELILESLEIIEQLDRNEGAPVTDSMKQAYRAVAVECTVRCFRVPGVSREEDQAKFFEAVMMIWRERIERMEKSELVTGELRELGEEMEMAVWDSEACKRLVGRFEESEAVRLVRVYVDEAFAAMGPSFIELCELKRKRKDGERVEMEEADKSNAGPEIVDSDGPERQELKRRREDVDEVQMKEGGKQAVLGGSPRQEIGELQQNDIMDSQIVETSKCNLNLVSVPEFVKVREALKRRFVDFKAMVGDLQHNDVYEACYSEIRNDSMDSEKVETSKCNLVSTPEVVKVREELRQSFVDLKAMVNDPLPEALRVSDVLRAEMREKSLHKETLVENQNGNDLGAPPINAEVSGVGMQSLDPVSSLVNQNINTNAETPVSSHQIVPPLKSTASTFNVPEIRETPLNPKISAENRNVHGIDAPSSTINAKVSEAATEILNPVPLQVILNRMTDSELPTSSHKIVPPNRSLMERNSTAKTFAWNDSIDSISQETTHSMEKDNLPTASSSRKFASLKANKLAARRKPHKFSLEEEDALREGVQKYGVGNWTLILNSKQSVFIDRTAVDLKDKWRNLTRSSGPLKDLQ
ncbi:Telomeric repeat-binding factor 2 [Euphorbia peplus]|nr:Telomeric repeat-binding factor 2 [Euphorbia peplus]